MIHLEGKKFVIMGVANQRSIAWSIAKSLHNAGAQLIFTYVGERFEKTVKDLVSTLEGQSTDLVFPCDVTSDESIEACFKTIYETVGNFDGIAHCVAFANKDELKGEYLNTNRDGFLLAQNISAYSLTAVCKAARPMLNPGSGIITLTYYGGEKVFPNYNVMGVAKASLDMSARYLAADLGKDDIRVNIISAGPIRTLSAKGVGDFNLIIQEVENNAPLRRATTADEVGDTAAFLMSPLSRGITGELIHVDSGFHVMGGRYPQ